MADQELAGFVYELSKVMSHAGDQRVPERWASPQRDLQGASYLFFVEDHSSICRRIGR